ncbi:hypothetical protein LK994_10575 [Ferruginibacter lapsinanis]|uniref:hypothetical protein n=1 Tax=Ferruginibacter lapsinanis TaxID=563172 RepID=UPI001E333442|nr:hypothetical protein [Ferruginibacter lapsinanis]UEG49074.1 hypothetical protein LK994_10575 [Ferruginibacter lapsinanis]
MILQINQEEKDRCYQFAESIIGGGNQFNRFNQNRTVQVHRTYIGKLAEYVFLHFLHSNGIDYEEGDMFEIFEGAENADTYDFVLPNGETIDIKTASLPFHRRIMIPISQFHLRKDYYIGIKLNFESLNRTILPFSITNCVLYGYVQREIMERQPTQNFGEGDCKAYELNRLVDIGNLINMF